MRAGAVFLAISATLVSLPDAAYADSFAIELSFEADMEPCFTGEALQTSVLERLGPTIAGGAPSRAEASISMRVHVAPATPGVLRATITSHSLDGGDEGQREILVEGGCEAVLAPLSLVMALLVDRGEPEPSPSPAAPPTQTPAVDPNPRATPSAPQPAAPPAPALTAPPPPVLPVATQPVASEQAAARNAISVQAGAGLGIMPQVVPVVGFGGRLGLTPQHGEYVPVVSELGIELLLPQRLALADRSASIVGGALHAALCAFWQHGWGRIGFQPCAGLWLRVLHATGRGSGTVFDARDFASAGWSLGATLHGSLGGAWSAFAGARALVPFASRPLDLDARPGAASAQAMGTGPFFNPSGAGPKLPSASSFRLYETPSIGGAVLAGIAFAL